MKEPIYYFKHNSNSIRDMQLIELRYDYGFLGYGLYWATVELLASNDNKLQFSNLTIIATELRIDSKIYNKFISDCISKYKLFKSSKKSFWIENFKIKRKNNLVSDRLYCINITLWYSITSKVFKRDNYTCSYCGQIGGKLECDHKKPFSKGGTNRLSNLTTACQRCNRQKRDKTVKQFIKWRKHGKTS